MYKVLFLLAWSLGVYVPLAAQPEVSVRDLNKKMARSDDYVLLDVRTPGEVEEGYIEGALNIDVKEDNFESRISSLDKSKTYYVYCEAGVRSAKAANLMLQQGFTSVYSVKGGIRDWKKKKLPVIRAK